MFYSPFAMKVSVRIAHFGRVPVQNDLHLPRPLFGERAFPLFTLRKLEFPPVSAMPRKQGAGVKGSMDPLPSSLPTLASEYIPRKRRASSKHILAATSKMPRVPPKPPLKRTAPSIALVAPEDRKASSYKNESQNPNLDDTTQTAQARKPLVNSDILPLPWRGRLGYAYDIPLPGLITDVLTPSYENLNPRYFAVGPAEWIQFSATKKRREKELSLQKTSADKMPQT
jgi:hypothetical protein